MKNITQRAFGVNLKLMWFVRLYTFEKPTKLFKFQAYFAYILFICAVPCLGILKILMEDNIDVDRIKYDSIVLTEAACFIVKYLPFIKNVKQIKKCINYFEYSTLSRGINSNQEDIIEECIKTCRRNTFIYLSAIAGGIVAFVVRPLFWDVYVLPVAIWLPFDSTSEPYIFYLIYLFIVISFIYMATTTSAIDPLIGGLACLVTGQLKILQSKLQYLDDYANIILKEPKRTMLDKAELIYNQIQNCVDQHNEIKLFTEEFEECFSSCIFYQIMASALVICFSCLEVVIKVQTADATTIYIMCTSGLVVMAQIYFYCYYGSTIFEESDNLTRAVYMGNWYDFDIKSKKAVSILMTRTQKPLSITSGKILELSLETFALVLKRSYSLMAVLKNYY